MLEMTDGGYYKAIKDYSTIMIFGANLNGKMNHHYCKTLGKDVSCYLVSSQSARAGSVINGVPVRRIDDISPNEKQGGLVIVGRSYENHQETVRLLQEHGFRHIIPGINQSTSELDEEQTALLKSIFGNDLVLDIPALEEEKDCSMQIYAVTSTGNFRKAHRSWNSKYIKYIQAGAALTKERICELTDDTGENISQYNHYINESTAGYWIAKNDVSHKYVGLFHYSRGMDLSDRQIEWIAEHDIDVVLKTPDIFMYDILSFSGSIYKAVCQCAPDYTDAVNCYFSNRFLCQGTIQISKREIFREFYEWALHVLKKYGEICPASISIAGDERHFAAVMENLLTIWYIKNAGRFRFAFAPWLQLAGEHVGKKGTPWNSWEETKKN